MRQVYIEDGRVAEDACPKSNIEWWEHGPAEELHTCPFKVEIHNDEETLCRCCEKCAHECAMDV